MRRRAAPTASPRERLQFLTFELGGDEYGVPILKVREIVPYEAATALPSAPGWIRGVVSLRGEVLPVVDTAVKFGLPPPADTSRASVVVYETAAADERRVAVGALVDAVSRVLEVDLDEIRPAPALGSQLRVQFLSGTAVAGGRLVLLLDTDRLLTAEELLAVSEARAVASPA